MRARNIRHSRVSSGEVGRAVKMRAATGPACDSSKEVEEAPSSRNKFRWQKPSTAWGTARCQPRVLSSCGSSSMEHVVPGVQKTNGGQRVGGSLQRQLLRQLVCCFFLTDFSSQLERSEASTTLQRSTGFFYLYCPSAGRQATASRRLRAARAAASWATWADTVPALLKRDRPFALRLVQGLDTAQRRISNSQLAARKDLWC